MRCLNWDLFKLTPLHFIKNLIGQGIVFSNDKLVNKGQQMDERVLRSVKKHTEFFVDLAIQEYEYQAGFRPSIVAASCILCARRVSKVVPEWNPALEEITDFTYGEIRVCAEKLYKTYEK
jgi:hypothetical protein